MTPFFFDMLTRASRDTRNQIFEMAIPKYEEYGRQAKVRHYHNLDHIWKCLQVAETVLDAFDNPELAYWALFFHDLEYTPGFTRNEEFSAAWATQMLSQGTLIREQCDAVEVLILSTKHRGYAKENDSRLVCDIDLLGLSCSEEQYKVNADNI